MNGMRWQAEHTYAFVARGVAAFQDDGCAGQAEGFREEFHDGGVGAAVFGGGADFDFQGVAVPAHDGVLR